MAKNKDNAFGTTEPKVSGAKKPTFEKPVDPNEYDDSNWQDDSNPEAKLAAHAAAAAEQDEEEVVDEPEAATEKPESQADAGKEQPGGGDDASEEGEEVEKVSFPPELLSAAGLTEKEAVDYYGTPDVLEQQIRSMDARFVQAGQSYFPPDMQVPQLPGVPPQPQQAAQPTEDEPFELPVPDGFDEWDEDIQKLATEMQKGFQKQLKKHLAERDKALKQHEQALSNMMVQSQRAQQQQYVQDFDGFISDLGDDWKPVFGSGDGYSLPVDSLALQNRAHLDRVAAQLAAGRQAFGQPPLGQKDILQRALRVAFPEVQKREVRREVVNEVSKRQRLVTERPTHRRSKQMTGEERAIKAAEEYYRKHNMGVEQDDFDYETL